MIKSLLERRSRSKVHIAETLQLYNYNLDFNIIQDAESTPRFEKKKKIKHVNAETSSHGKMNLGIVLMLNYLLFKLHCSLGNYVSLKFHQAEQTNKEKNNHIFVAMYQIDNKT